MKKTISLKTAKEILINQSLSGSEREKVIESHTRATLPEFEPVVWQKYTLDGKQKIHTYCHACKKHGEVDRAQKCPHCGNATRLYGASGIARTGNLFSYILQENKDEGYFIFLMTPEISKINISVQNADLSFKYMEKYMESPIKRELCLTESSFENSFQIGMFVKNKGFLFQNCPSRNSTSHQMQKHDFMRSTVLNEDNMHSFTGGIDIKEFCAKFETNQSSGISHKNCSQAAVDAVELGRMELPHHTVKDLPEPDAFSLWETKTNFGQYFEKYYYCSVCKKVTLKKGVSESQHGWICPECKTQFHFSMFHSSHQETKTLAEFAPNLQDIILRGYSIKYVLNADGELQISEEEVYRIMLNPKQIIASDLLERKKINIRDLGGWLYPVRMIQTSEQLKEIIYNSSVAHTGLAEWIDCVEASGRASIIQYLNAWHKAPQIELLMKCGMKNVAYSIFNAPTTWLKAHGRSKATNPIDFLGISKFVFREAREHNLSIEQIKSLQKLWETDNSINFNIFQKLSDMNILDKAINVRNKYNVSYKRILEYLENVENYQCCPQKEAFSIWYDYLDLASKINYDLTQRSVKFPNSLKKAHDIASYAYDAVAEELHEKEFAERALENDRYAFSDGDYIVKIPHSQQELIRESQVLNHCVKVYIDRVREGDTIIAFLRNADEPHTPLYTMEIRDGVIAQLKGFCNRTLNDAKMLSFVKKFAEEKHLKQKFSY